MKINVWPSPFMCKFHVPVKYLAVHDLRLMSALNVRCGAEERSDLPYGLYLERIQNDSGIVAGFLDGNSHEDVGAIYGRPHGAIFYGIVQFNDAVFVIVLQ